MSGREGSAWAESANVQQQVARQNLTRDCQSHALLWWHRQPKRRRRYIPTLDHWNSRTKNQSKEEREDAQDGGISVARAFKRLPALSGEKH